MDPVERLGVESSLKGRSDGSSPSARLNYSFGPLDAHRSNASLAHLATEFPGTVKPLPGASTGAGHVPLADHISSLGDAPAHSSFDHAQSDELRTIRHVDSGNQILQIASLKGGKETANSQTQGLYLVSNRGARDIAVDIVFVYDIYRGSHPYHDWLNDKGPAGPDYLPNDVEAHIPLARVWAYGYQSSSDDATPLSSPANNFLVYYQNQRLRDRKNNPGESGFLLPKLIFICVGIGGLVVKKILLDCHKSSSDVHQSIAHSCLGVIFLSTPHTTEQKELYKLWKMMNIYPKAVLRTLTDDTISNLGALVHEANSVNTDFLSSFSKMPPTLCVVNMRKFFGQASPQDTYFQSEVRREGLDMHLSVVENNPRWRTLLHKKHPVFITMMKHIHDWVRDEDVRIPPPDVQYGGDLDSNAVNLLSIDGGGVRGLASLLIMAKIMREVARKEVAEDPTTSRKYRIPADYFDLAGGTSTGGLICIMLFRLRMDIESAISEYRRLSPRIFHTDVTRFLGANFVKTTVGKPWFDGENLEIGVKGIVRGRLSWQERERLGHLVDDARLNPHSEDTLKDSCKTFLCALRKDDNSAVRFRAYEAPDNTETPFSNCKIWEAARATSAAPFYFPSAVVAGIKFWDGGLANNNPVFEVLAERSQVYPGQPVKSVLSLGTGFSERKMSRSSINMLGKGKQVLENVTNVKNNHERAREQLRAEGVPYFRFDPSTAEDKIGLADYKLLDALENYTERYLEQDDVKLQIERCAELLYHRSDGPSVRVEEPVMVDRAP